MDLTNKLVGKTVDEYHRCLKAGAYSDALYLIADRLDLKRERQIMKNIIGLQDALGLKNPEVIKLREKVFFMLKENSKIINNNQLSKCFGSYYA